jgi:hypothetical protein
MPLSEAQGRQEHAPAPLRLHGMSDPGAPGHECSDHEADGYGSVFAR